MLESNLKTKFYYFLCIFLIISLIFNPDIHVGTFLPKAFAVTQTSYVRGANYNDTGFSNQTHIWNGGIAPWIVAANGSYTPYRITNVTAGMVIETGFGTYLFNKNTCLMGLHTPSLNPTNSSQLVNSFIIGLSRSTSNVNSTFQATPVNNAPCTWSRVDTGNQFTINATKSDVNGTFGITYKLQASQKLKTTYFFNPSISGFFWKIQETQKSIPSTIILANASYVLNNITNTKNITSTLITNSVKNSTQVILSNGTVSVNYNYQTSLPSLSATKIYLNSTSGQAYLVNTWQSSSALNINQKFTIDPTYGYTAGTTYTPRHSGCSGAVYNFIGGISYATNNAYCATLVYKWDISSIPTTVAIISANFQYDINAVQNPRQCDYWSIEKDPAISSAQTVFQDSFNGTNFVSSDNGCQTTGTDKILNLGGLGSPVTSNIISSLSVGWWGLGQTFTTPDTQGGAGVIIRSEPLNPRLQITYSVSTLTISTFYNNGTIMNTMNVIDTNSSKSQTKTVDSSGKVTFTGLSDLQNYTYKETQDNFVVNKTLNFIGTSTSMNAKTYIFDVDCNINGAGNDLELKLNDTDGHHITSFTTPSCASNANVSGSVTWTANGNNVNSFSSKMLSKILNTITFGANAKTFQIGGSTISTSYSSPKITSSSFTVGTGLTTVTKSYWILLDGTPPPPTSPTSSSSSATNIALGWTAPNTGGVAISGYEVEISTENINWSVYNANVGNVNGYLVVGLQPNTMYYFRISTITSLGTSSPSTTTSTTTGQGGTGSPSDSGGSSGGAPASNPTPTTPPPPPVQLNSESVIIGNTLISIQPKTYQLTFGTTLPSESFQFTWNSTKDISVTKIDQATSPITIGNSLLFPYTMKGNSQLIGSTGIVPFSLTIPDQCTNNSTSTCANPTTYNIPVTFTIKVGDQTGTITSNISIDLSRNQSLTVFVVFFSVIAIVTSGIIYRFVLKRKKTSNQNRPNKEITKFIQKVESKSSSRHPFSEKKSKSIHNRPDNSWSKRLNKVEKESRNRFG